MIINEKIKLSVFTAALAAALTIALPPFLGWAEAPMDGIPVEVQSIDLPPGCQADCTSYPVDPDKGDVFVVTAVKGDPSSQAFLEIQNPFEFFITNQKVNLHIISEDQTQDQKVYERQYAVKVYEDRNLNVEALGMTDLGTPVDKLSGDIYINRIIEEVEKACPDNTYTSIVDGTNIGGEGQVGIDAVAEFYIKNVIAHETFHMLGRVRPKDRKYDYHTAQLGLIMDHHMFYKISKRDKTVRWYISDMWLHAFDGSGEVTGDIPAF